MRDAGRTAALEDGAGLLGPKSTSRSARDASKGSAIRLAAEIVVRLSSIVATLWLTRSLGVSVFGALLVALSIGLMIAELSDLGLNAIVVPSIVRRRGNLRSLFGMKAVATAVVAGLCAPLIPLASWLSGMGPGILGLCTIHFLGASWIEMTGTTLRALGRGVEEALLLFAFRLSLLVLVIAGPFGMTLWGVSVSYALAVAPGLAFGGFLLRSEARRKGAPASDVRSIVRQALPMGVNGYLAILSTRVELFLLQILQGGQVVGLFGGALRIVESLLTLPSAIAAGALPSVARDATTGSRGAAQRMFGLVVWIGVPSALGLGLCARDVLLVLGPGFVDGAPALQALSAALLLCFANAALFHVLIAAGDTAVIPRLTGLRVGVAVMLGVIAVPALGQVGAALSFTCAECFLSALLVRRVRTHCELLVIRPVAWAALACVPMALLLALWSLSLPSRILLGVALFAGSTAVILRRGTEANGLA